MSASPNLRLLWTVITVRPGLERRRRCRGESHQLTSTYHGLREAPDTAAVTTAALQGFARAYPGPQASAAGRRHRRLQRGRQHRRRPGRGAAADRRRAGVPARHRRRQHGRHVGGRRAAWRAGLHPGGQPRPRRRAPARLPHRPRGRRPVHRHPGRRRPVGPGRPARDGRDHGERRGGLRPRLPPARPDREHRRVPQPRRQVLRQGHQRADPQRRSPTPPAACG